MFAREGRRAIKHPKSVHGGAFAAMTLILACIAWRCISRCRRCVREMRRRQNGYQATLVTEESDVEDGNGDDDDDDHHMGLHIRASADDDDEENEGAASLPSRRWKDDDANDDDIAPPLSESDRRVVPVD